MEEKSLATRESSQVQVTQSDLDDWLFGTDTKLNDRQKALFYKVAMSSNLNPIKKEIYAIAYGSNFNIIVGYEVYLKRAERTGLLEYWEATVKKDEAGEWVGKCTIKRKDFSKPVTVEAWFSEYNQGTAIWKTKPRTMIRKVAISQGFRMVFSDELGGLPYTSDEIIPNEVKELEYTSMEEITDKAGKKEAEADLADRRGNAIAYLLKKGKTSDDAVTYLGKAVDIWKQEDLDALKKWAKAGFPETPQTAPVTDPQPSTPAPEKEATTGGTEAQNESSGPTMDELLAVLGGKGWPTEKLQIKFGKKQPDWDDAELKALADLAAAV
jgi:phage recombination protein Bet